VVSGGGFLHLKGVVEALLAALRSENAAADLDVSDFRHDLLAADRACELKWGGRLLGILGEVSASGQKAFGLRQPATVLELNLDALVEAARLITTYEPQSPYPTISRDLNLIVEEAVRWADLAAAVRYAAGADLEQLEYLDTYRDPQKDGPNTKRLIFSVTLRAKDRTLTGPEADTVRDAIVTACQERFGARLLG
jgi:phenylalanyl-tRNA synthetase beta chain